MVPRLALIGLTFGQAFLINSARKSLGTPVNATSANSGYGLIGVTALIYTGIAISIEWYWHCHQRALAMIRGMLGSTCLQESQRFDKQL